MVKSEEGDCDSSSNIGVPTGNAPKPEVFDHAAHIGVDQESKPGSSSSQLRSDLIAMGFSPARVDSTIQRHGGNDIDTIIEALCSKTDAETSNVEYVSYPDHVRGHDGEDKDLDFDFSSSDSDEEGEKKPDVNIDKKSLLLKMKFSDEEIDLALIQLGCNASLPKVIDYILLNPGGNFGKQSRSDAMLQELSEIRDRALILLDMGFSEEEVSTAIEVFGSAAAVGELADSIFANRIADGCVKEETDMLSDKDTIWSENEQKVTHEANDDVSMLSDKDTIRCWKEPEFIGETINDAVNSDEWESKPTTSNSARWESGKITERKRGRWQDLSSSKLHCRLGVKMGKAGSVSSNTSWSNTYEEKLYDKMIPKMGVYEKKIRSYCPSPPPYFFFGNVADSPQETWDRFSRFLYGVDPESANTQYFSALNRKEIYFHNLPTTNRFHILPRPPMTIEEALPETRRWWPSWDTRKQLGCINSDCTNVTQTCERLGRTMMSSHGILSKEQQVDILHQCKTLNLLWVGDKRLQAIKADHVEYILGYPAGHTKIAGLEETDRLMALKYSFQIDTLSYHLSTLKQLYPAGMRVLSVFTGIGGAEIALTKLGLHLLCVVSVEASEINRAIFKRWWNSSGQSGELRQVVGIERLGSQKLESLMNEFGGFDLIFSGNPRNCVYGHPRAHDADGVDFSLFCESVRIFQHVRSILTKKGRLQ